MLPSGAIDFFLNRHGSANCFFLLGSFSFLIGYILFRKSKESFQNLPPLTLFLATSVIWLFMALFSALPFYFSSFFPSFMDAFFESMSGLTTTGASVLPSPENLTAGLMLWRMLLQWIGGIGIIVLALFLFPSLKTKGFSLFSTESSDISEKNFPLFSQNIRMIFRTYLFISFLCFLALSFAGLSPFDALLHMMATVSTGGVCHLWRFYCALQSPAFCPLGIQLFHGVKCPSSFQCCVPSNRPNGKDKKRLPNQNFLILLVGRHSFSVNLSPGNRGLYGYLFAYHKHGF
ncbi:MAG: TrkH family potassium uptake protein [Alphaproteobacteria bacterium]|nr:TrkH family potassium uptake protein [Alphaproteobacteria bacterium]